MAMPSVGRVGEAKKGMDFGALLKSAMTDTLHADHVRPKPRWPSRRPARPN